MRTRQLALWFAVSICAFATTSMAVVRNLNDPLGLSSNINTLNRTIATNVGNYSLAEFNSNTFKKTFTFDSANNYTNLGDTLSSISLTNTVSGINLKTTFTKSGGSIGNYIDNGAGRMSSGDQVLTYDSNVTNVTISFDHPLFGVGMILSRLVAPRTVQMWSSSGQIGSDYTVPINGASGFSFFGYYNSSAAQITGIRINNTPGASAFWLDDLSVIATAVPEPSSLATMSLGLAGILLLRRRCARR